MHTLFAWEQCRDGQVTWASCGAAAVSDGSPLMLRRFQSAALFHLVFHKRIRPHITKTHFHPIFFLPEYGKTSAEISPEEKNAISHRGKALRLMREELKEALS